MVGGGMAVKDISDVQVCLAVETHSHMRSESPGGWCQGIPSVAEILEMMTGQCYKVCVQAIQRAHKRGYVRSEVREWLATPLPEGYELIARHERFRVPFVIETTNGISKMVVSSPSLAYWV